MQAFMSCVRASQGQRKHGACVSANFSGEGCPHMHARACLCVRAVERGRGVSGGRIRCTAAPAAPRACAHTAHGRRRAVLQDQPRWEAPGSGAAGCDHQGVCTCVCMCICCVCCVFYTVPYKHSLISIAMMLHTHTLQIELPACPRRSSLPTASSSSCRCTATSCPCSPWTSPLTRPCWCPAQQTRTLRCVCVCMCVCAVYECMRVRPWLLMSGSAARKHTQVSVHALCAHVCACACACSCRVCWGLG